MTGVGEIVAALDEFAPRHLAESWDNVGLLVGDPDERCDRVLVAYDVTEAVLDEATARGAQTVIAFHPPIFRPLARVTASDPAAAVVHRAVRAGLSLAATHTALDNARPGTSDFLAEALGLVTTGVLRTRSEGYAKLAVFTPAEAVDQVAAAMAAAGAGRIGDYAECGFRLAGQGTFRPLAGASPTVGEVGRLEQVDEIRLEMLVPRERAAAVVTAMVRAHPYEEVAYDLYPLLNETEYGLGRLAELPEPVPLADFARRVGEATGARHLRWVGGPDRLVRRAALVGGSGAGYLPDAAAAGADVFVTGDVKHHDALLAGRLGVGLVDPGHWATERFVVPRTAAWLRARLPAVKVDESEVDGEPFAR